MPWHTKKGGGGLRCGHSPNRGVLGAGTPNKKRGGVLGAGTTRKGGGGVFGTATTRKRGIYNWFCKKTERVLVVYERELIHL